MSAPIERLRHDPRVASAVDTLGDLSAADLRSVLLHLASQRVGTRSASDLVRQYGDDRFCAPGVIDPIALAMVGATIQQRLAETFEPVLLSPLAPLGTSSIVGPVPQHNVVTTMRLTDVAADPTNALALEAAQRRRHDPTETVRLSGIHRVVRAQRFDGPASFAHFSLLGNVSAGRDRGDRMFEVDELERHITGIAAAVGQAAPDLDTHIAISDHSGRYDEAEALASRLETAGCHATIDPDRTHGIGYYEHLCFKLAIEADGKRLEIGDGGSVPWTRDLLANRKERLVISGIGLDRLVLMLGDQPPSSRS